MTTTEPEQPSMANEEEFHEEEFEYYEDANASNQAAEGGNNESATLEEEPAAEEAAEYHETAEESSEKKEEEFHPEAELEGNEGSEEEPAYDHHAGGEDAPADEYSSQDSPSNRIRSEGSAQNQEETIQKLKQANKELKAQLLELNKLLDLQLQQKGVKVPGKTKKTLQSANEKELKALAKQVEVYKKANEDLKKQVFGLAGADKLTQLENLVKEKAKMIEQLQEENKGFRNQVREQSKALEKFSAGQDKTVGQISSDFRILKLNYQKMKDKNTEMQSEIEKQNERYAKLQSKTEKLEEALKASNMSVDGAAMIKKMKQEMEEKDKEINELKKKLDVEQKSKLSVVKKCKSDVNHMQTELKKYQEQANSLKTKLEMKDKEMRMNALQMKQSGSPASSSERSGSAKGMKRETSVNRLPSREKKHVKSKSEAAVRPVDRGNSKIPLPKHMQKVVKTNNMPNAGSDAPQPSVSEYPNALSNEEVVDESGNADNNYEEDFEGGDVMPTEIEENIQPHTEQVYDQMEPEAEQNIITE